MLQAAGDKAQAAKDTVVDTAAKGTQNVQDAVKPYADAAADKTKAGGHLLKAALEQFEQMKHQ